MKHTTHGWAVQYKARNHKWCFDTEHDGNVVFHARQDGAKHHKGLLSETNAYRIETRIVRVRQTTEVIEG